MLCCHRALLLHRDGPTLTPPCQCQYCTVSLLSLATAAAAAVAGREEAIRALKQSVRLNNPSDWQLLTELTSDAEASATY